MLHDYAVLLDFAIESCESDFQNASCLGFVATRIIEYFANMRSLN